MGRFERKGSKGRRVVVVPFRVVYMLSMKVHKGV